MTNLAAIALALPGVERGIACAGTALESRTYSVNRKAFLFVSKDCVRLKLERSIPEARKHGAQVGSGGWTKLPTDDLPPTAMLERWVAESHAVIAGGSGGKKAGAPPRAPRKR